MEKLDYLGPQFVFAAVAALMGDLVFLFAIGAFIPLIGLVILAGVLAAHYFFGLIVGALVIPKLKHFIPKLILGLAILLPLPTLLLGLILAVVAQNRLIELILTQVAIQAVAAVTGGAGEALEAAEVGAGAAEAGAAAVEAGTAAAEVGAEAAEVGAEAVGTAAEAEAGAGAAEEAGAKAAGEVSPEALGEEPDLLEKLKKITDEAPREEQKEDKQDEEGVDINEENNSIDLR